MQQLASILDGLYVRHVTKRDQALLDLVFNPAPAQEDVDAGLAVADIEVLGAHKALLLSYFVHDNPQFKLTQYVEPRLHGLIRFFRFQNMRTLAHFSRIGKALNKAGIPFAVFKGAAMKALRPQLARPMGDTDILLARGTIKGAVKICEGLGYQHIRGKPTHAIGMHTDAEDAVDLHYQVFDHGRDMTALQEGIFSRATQHNAFGVDFLLPASEDLFFLILANLAKNLHDSTTLDGLYYALCDSRYLLQSKPGFDFSIVREDARLGDKEMEIRFAAEFMNRIIHNFIVDLDEYLPYPENVEQFLRLCEFDERFFMPLRHICQQMRVAELCNYPFLHGKKIIKFLIMSKLRSHQGFVNWYLNRQQKNNLSNA